MNTNINIEKIFKTYGIEDATYLQNCQSALELVENNIELYNVIESVYSDLYDHCDYYLIEKIRLKSYEELFGIFAHNHFLTNLIALMGLSRSSDFGMKETISNILFWGSKGMRIRQMVFLSYIITDRIIEIDGFRFQYIEGKGSTNILIHITKQAYLPNFLETISKASNEIAIKWKIDFINYECESWMLSEEICDCLPGSSRILAFQKVFNISNGAECTTDILKFVFGIYETTNDINYCNLEENTVLQKKVKEKLLNGRKFYYGIGKLKQ